MLLFLVVSTILLLLVAPLYVVYKPPNIVISYFARKFPSVLFRVDTKDKVIALTIDDAPTEYTEEILALLAEFNATATFFVIGSQAQADGRREVLKSIVRSGNELGNHAMYDEPSRDLSPEVLLSQSKEVDQVIDGVYEENGTKRGGRYFRPGSGFFSREMLKVIERLNYRLVLGGIYPHDPQIPYWRVNARHILSMSRPGGIIICHDRRSWTIPMLRQVLPELIRRGYKVVTITELLKASQ